MSSGEAADWLVSTYPEGGQGIKLLPHRSWLKSDQDRLADHYLAAMPFAASWPYEALLSIMSVKRFLRYADAHYPNEDTDADLVLYHLAPALDTAVKTDNDAVLVASFLASRRTR